MKFFQPCYMCNRLATTTEHVPPKSFFPDNSREDLITVPSCILHNNSKSDDDEYLRILLTVGIAVNETALKDIFPKVRRSFEKAPKKLGILKNLRPVKVGDIETGMFDIDSKRFVQIIDSIDRGIYFHMFKQSWMEDLVVFPPTGVAMNLTDNRDNILRRNLESLFNRDYGDLEKQGKNQDAFYYQYAGNKNTGILRKTFFGGVSMISVFNLHLIGSLQKDQQIV